MPIFHWYLVKNYLKVLFLSMCSFISILLVSRLEDIAQFATLGAKPLYLTLFTLYQIPYILPIAIPISCLISSTILFMRLSHTCELTALRSCGISLYRIIFPVILVGFFLSLGTFYIASEIATASHLATRKMMHSLFSVNPILLLQSTKIANLKDAYVQMDPIRNGESAKNLFIALHNTSGERISLCLAKKVELRNDKLLVVDVSLISSSPSKQAFDHLIIENQKFMCASKAEFANLLRKTGWKMANDHLKFSLLRIRAQKLKEQINKGLPMQRHLKKCQSECVRRFSLGLSAFSFTLLGLSFGIQISRNHKKSGLFILLVLATFCLLAFCMGKSISHVFWLASVVFMLPHVTIIGTSLLALKRINKGIE